MLCLIEKMEMCEGYHNFLFQKAQKRNGWICFLEIEALM